MSSCRAGVWTVIRADKLDPNESRGFVTLLARKHYIDSSFRFIEENDFAINYRYRPARPIRNHFIKAPNNDVKLGCLSKLVSVFYMKHNFNFTPSFKSPNCFLISSLRCKKTKVEKTFDLIYFSQCEWLSGIWSFDWVTCAARDTDWFGPICWTGLLNIISSKEGFVRDPDITSGLCAWGSGLQLIVLEIIFSFLHRPIISLHKTWIYHQEISFGLTCMCSFHSQSWLTSPRTTVSAKNLHCFTE